MKRVEKDILMSDLIYKHLRGALRGNEADILEAWLQKPENMRFFMGLKNSDCLYEDVEKMKYTDEQAAWWQMEAKMAKVRRRRWMRRFYSIAALIIVVLGCGWILLSESKKVEKTELLVPMAAIGERIPVTVWKLKGKEVQLADTLQELVLTPEVLQSADESLSADSSVEEPVHYEELITAPKDKLQVVLFDGTRVWLNGGSRLKFPSRFTMACREVELFGEAYFEVTKDTLRPFIVRTTSSKVEVLGTSFNVSAQGEQGCVATLVEGKVRMQDKNEHKVVLAPGQQAVLDEKGGWRVEEVDVRYFTAWKDGKFAFKDAQLETVLKKLSSYYGVQFKFENAQVAALTYTTIIKQYKKVEDVLLILEKVGDFKCECVGENLYLVKRK